MAFFPPQFCSTEGCVCKTPTAVCAEFYGPTQDMMEKGELPDVCIRCGWQAGDHQLFQVREWETVEAEDGKVYAQAVSYLYPQRYAETSYSEDYLLTATKGMAETIASVIGGSPDHGLAMATAIKLVTSGVLPTPLIGLEGLERERHVREAAQARR